MFSVLVQLLPNLIRALGDRAAVLGAEETGRQLFDASRLALPSERLPIVAESLEALARHLRAEAIRRGR